MNETEIRLFNPFTGEHATVDENFVRASGMPPEYKKLEDVSILEWRDLFRRVKWTDDNALPF